MAAAVAQATGADATVLRGMLQSDKGYVVLVPLVDPDVARKLREQDARGNNDLIQAIYPQRITPP